MNNKLAIVLYGTSWRLPSLGAKLEVDGRLGLRTVAAMNALEGRALLAKMREMRSAYYRNLAASKPALAVFLHGWLRRAAA